MTKTILGVAIALLLNWSAILFHYYLDPKGALSALWVCMVLSSWPIMGWGAYKFSQYRGYAGSAGAAMTVLANVTFILIVHGSHNPPSVHIIGAGFVAAFPIAVLLAMPNKGRPSYSRRRRSQSKHRQEG